MKKDLKINGKINIESVNDEMSIEVRGNGFSIMNLLTILSNQLIQQTNLDKDDILFAVNLGLEDEIEKRKKTNNLADQLSEMLKDALMGKE